MAEGPSAAADFCNKIGAKRPLKRKWDLVVDNE